MRCYRLSSEHVFKEVADLAEYCNDYGDEGPEDGSDNMWAYLRKSLVGLPGPVTINTNIWAHGISWWNTDGDAEHFCEEPTEPRKRAPEEVSFLDFHWIPAERGPCIAVGVEGRTVSEVDIATAFVGLKNLHVGFQPGRSYFFEGTVKSDGSCMAQMYPDQEAIMRKAPKERQLQIHWGS